MTDPFRHHPGLRDLIDDPMKSRFRGWEPWDLARSTPALDLNSFLLKPEGREANRQRTLSRRPTADLWVFAYWSLMWDPAFCFYDVRRARVEGYERRFIIRYAFGGRGDLENSGLMAALDHGQRCNGLAFLILADRVEEETTHIWTRERSGHAYCETFVETDLGDKTVQAVTFVADHSAEIVVPDISRAYQITYAATGKGIFGTSMEYVEHLAGQFAVLGVADAEVTDLLAQAKAYPATLQ